MKPDNWDKLPLEDRSAIAHALFQSMRGSLIIGQALAHAIEVMSKEEYPETSNIEDMEILGETLFLPFFSMYRDKLI